MNLNVRTPQPRSIEVQSNGPTKSRNSPKVKSPKPTLDLRHKKATPRDPFLEELSKLDKLMVDFDGEVQALGSAGRLSRAVGTVVLRLSELTRWFDRGTGSFALSSPVSISGSMGFSARLQESDSDSSLESDSSSDSHASVIILKRNVQRDDPTVAFAHLLHKLAKGIRILHTELNDMSLGLFYASRYDALVAFHDELLILAGPLRNTDLKIDDNVLRKYVRNSVDQMVPCIQEVKRELYRFCTSHGNGLLAEQTRAVQIHGNAATVAIFFAGVTATTLQFSFGDNSTHLSIATNIFWITSLAMSVGSAINSTLALAWRLAIFRSPNHTLPWWVLFWVKTGYIALLAGSASCFLVGLACFSRHTQHTVTFWSMIVVTSVFLLGLFCVIVWFEQDRRKFSRQRRKALKRSQVVKKPAYSEPGNWRGRLTNLFLSNGFQRLGPLNRIIKLTSPKDFQPPSIQTFSLEANNTTNESETHPWKLNNTELEKGKSIQSLAASGFAAAMMVPMFAGSSQLTSEFLTVAESGGDQILHVQFSPNGNWHIICSVRGTWIHSVDKSGKFKRMYRLPQARLQFNTEDILCSWSSGSDKVAVIRLGKRSHHRNHSHCHIKIVVELWRYNQESMEFITGDPLSVDHPLLCSGIEREPYLAKFSEDEIRVTNGSEDTVIKIQTVNGRTTMFSVVMDPKLLRPPRTAGKVKFVGDTSWTLTAAVHSRLRVGHLKGTHIPTFVSMISLAFHSNQGDRPRITDLPVKGKIRKTTVNQLKRSDIGNEEWEMLISYENKAPELWKVRLTDIPMEGRPLPLSIEINEYSTPQLAPNSVWGTSLFVGDRGKFVLTPVGDDLFLFSTTNSEVKCTFKINTHTDGTTPSCPGVAWNYATEKQTPMLTLVSGTQVSCGLLPSHWASAIAENDYMFNPPMASPLAFPTPTTAGSLGGADLPDQNAMEAVQLLHPHEINDYAYSYRGLHMDFD